MRLVTVAAIFYIFILLSNATSIQAIVENMRGASGSVTPEIGVDGTIFEFKYTADPFQPRIPLRQINITIQNPATSDEQLFLYDDGTHGDTRPYDGVYYGAWDSIGKPDGLYTASFCSNYITSRCGTKINKKFIKSNQCKELFYKHNDINDRRVNVVVTFINYEQTGFFNRATLARQLIEGTSGLLRVEPFKSNKNKFNFFVVDENGAVSDYQTGERQFGREALNETARLSAKCPLENKITNAVVNWDFRSNARGPNIYLSIGNRYFDQYTAVNTHEFGHAFGGLADEYTEDRSNLSVTRDEYDHLSTAIKNQCFFSPNVQCLMETRNPGTNYNFSYLVCGENCTYITNGTAHCDAANTAVAQCQENPAWRDLIGKGCGRDGVVDCLNQTPNGRYPAGYYLEERCVSKPGCYYPNLIRHDVQNIMYNYDRIDSTSLVEGFGPINERTLCRKIKEKTGSTSGICNNLCLAGCTNGQKCISGRCQNG